MKIVKLRIFAFELNAAIDTGKYSHITTDEIRQRIESGDVFRYLESQFKSDADFSALTKEDRKEMIDEWESMANAIDAKRKFGVSNSGLCLLMAYALQGIQQRSMGQ